MSITLLSYAQLLKIWCQIKALTKENEIMFVASYRRPHHILMYLQNSHFEKNDFENPSQYFTFLHES